MSWLFTLWSFTVAMLNIWAVCFCVKAIFYVVAFCINFVDNFKRGYRERK